MRLKAEKEVRALSQQNEAMLEKKIPSRKHLTLNQDDL